MDIGHTIQTICVYAIPLLFAITMHEAAHGWMASKFGDHTARMLGRVTLNPLPHVDPFGTIVLPLIMLVGSSLAGMGGMIFGWAKPVPVVTRYMRDPRWGMVWVAAAGPAANLLQGVFWAILFKILLLAGLRGGFFIDMCLAGISVNFILMALNLLPILPLDGGRILNGFLPVVCRVRAHGALRDLHPARFDGDGAAFLFPQALPHLRELVRKSHRLRPTWRISPAPPAKPCAGPRPG